MARLHETFEYLLEAILESSFFVTSIRFTLIDFFLFRVAFEIDGAAAAPLVMDFVMIAGSVFSGQPCQTPRIESAREEYRQCANLKTQKENLQPRPQ